MIEKLIEWCIGNRAMVVLLTVCLIAGGIWSAMNITVDAIPDLSDVQVVIRTEYPGQAPQIIEDQVTYPLTTAMLAVPQAKVVRGYSMFGTSFVYIIFEDGTDLYWSRSRVLEQLNVVSGKLPRGVTPELGPDATGVGWVYQYVLVTGNYCEDHPNGAWQDSQTGKWYETSEADGQDEDVQRRLQHHRVLDKMRTVYVNMEGRRFDRPEDAPPDERNRLAPLLVDQGLQHCPLDGKQLKPTEIDLADLRSLQDWYLRYELTAVEGVSEVAAVGGFVKQYQVTVDPVKLLAYDMPLQRIRKAIERSNLDVGGRLIEISETEYMVRGLGYLGGLTEEEVAAARESGERIEHVRSKKVMNDLRRVALGATESGSPIYLADVAEVRIGPEIRRGVADWDGQGEVVGGTIVMRFGENAQHTIERVRTRLSELERGLPPGVAIRVAYDRSDLIQRAIKTVSDTLAEEIAVVSLVIVLFLLHARSALVAAIVLPLGVLATLTIMYVLDINANIMSLGGIAISIGVMVDSAVVMVENAHKHLERENERIAAGHTPKPRAQVIGEAAREVGPTLFFSLLVITVSFLPIFVLGEQSGRLFRPLAFTKTFAMTSAAFLAITIVPVLMVYFISERTVPLQWARAKRYTLYLAVILLPAAIVAFVPQQIASTYRWSIAIAWIVASAMIMLPQRIISEQRNPLSNLLQRCYNPLFVLVMRFRWLTLAVALLLMGATYWPLQRLGSEFMPPLEEGDLLYMPTTVEPGLSITKARELLQQTDRIIAQFPEVDRVFGKIGRSETATDPAPLNMIETTITLHRDKGRWRQIPVERFYHDWPKWMRKPFEQAFAETRPITTDELIYGYKWPDGRKFPGMNESLQLPGLANSWTMPIKTRIDMLSTGIKTPVGIKVMGPDLQTLSSLASQISQIVRTNDLTGPYTTSAFAEKTVGGNYFDIEINREQIARYGLNVADVQEVIMTALGGMNITSTVEGLERYPVNLRYPSELRDNLPALNQTLVATPTGSQVPLEQLASVKMHKGPPMIKSENARLTAWVFVDIAGLDVGTYVQHARKAVADAVDLPPGYSLVWSGQFEYMQAARKRLMLAIPFAGILIVLLLYLATRSWLRVAILLLSLPFSLVGAVWLVYLLDYNWSLAIWVGVIALAGLAAETGLVMLLYLDNSFDRFKSEGRMRNTDDLWYAIHEGAVQRIRPKSMTVMTTFIGLVPLLWATGAGADTMRRLAAPMIGGLATAFILELLLYPVIFYITKRIAMRNVFRDIRNNDTTWPESQQSHSIA